MHHGIGSLAVSIVSCAPTSRCAINGFTSKKIPFAAGSSNIGKIGPTKSASTTPDCKASTSGATYPRQAERLPYNGCFHENIPGQALSDCWNPFFGPQIGISDHENISQEIKII
jgi:hypothetical protein